MKNLLTILTVFFVTLTYAQSANDFFSNSEATMSFIGLDFSSATMVATGEAGSKNKEMFEAWNGLMATEADKYEVSKAFGRKGTAILDIEVTDAVNKKVDAEKINAHSAPKTVFKESQIQEMVNAYDLEKVKTKYAMSFVIHSFNKTTEKAIIYPVLIDVKTKKVLWSTELETEPSGFGYKSYWAGTIYDAVKAIKGKYKKWGKELSK